MAPGRRPVPSRPSPGSPPVPGVPVPQTPAGPHLVLGLLPVEAGTLVRGTRSTSVLGTALERPRWVLSPGPLDGVSAQGRLEGEWARSQRGRHVPRPPWKDTGNTRSKAPQTGHDPAPVTVPGFTTRTGLILEPGGLPLDRGKRDVGKDTTDLVLGRGDREGRRGRDTCGQDP